MANKNKQISNPLTGQSIKFIQTGSETDGKLLEMEATFNPQSKEPSPHYHPFQIEDFEVISGQLTVKIDGEIKLLNPGDKLHIPTNKVHSMWNNSKGKTIVNWIVQPALHTDHLLETATGLAVDGKTNADGMPDLLQTVLLANKYSNEFRLSRPPFAIQKILFLILTPIAYLLGYKASYKKYID